MEKTIQPLRFNPILNTDSYKLTHWWQYPANTRHIYSYVCSRGGFFDHSEMAGLQYIVKSNFAGKVFTLEDVEDAAKFANQHFSNNPKVLQLRGLEASLRETRRNAAAAIKAVKEGSVVAAQNAIVTVENTDPEFYWLTNWAETMLLQIWYPVTVATLSRAIKQIVGEALDRTGDPAGIAFKLHDFGFRGVSSRESAAIGGAAHLFNFVGTDNLPAIELLRQYYGCGHAGRQHSRLGAFHDHVVGPRARSRSV